MPKTMNLISADCTLPELQKKIEELAGGKSLKELLNEGLLRRADGTSYLKEGQTLDFEPDQKRYNEPEYDALTDARTNGVFLYTRFRSSAPRPALIHAAEGKVEVVQAMSDTEVLGVVSAACGVAEKPSPVSRPGFFNRVKNFFKRGGTPEMNAYKKYQDDLKKYNENLARAQQQAQAMKSFAGGLAADEAEEIHTEKTREQGFMTGLELKARYDRMEIVPCQTQPGEVSKVSALLTDTRNLLEPVATGIVTKFVMDPKGVSKGMAAMTAVDLILRERRSNGYVKGDEKPVVPGPIETKLNQVGETEFINMIRENAAFKAETVDMTSRKLDDFVSKNQVHTLSGKVLDNIVAHEAEKFGISAGQKTAVAGNIANELGEPDQPSVGALGH